MNFKKEYGCNLSFLDMLFNFLLLFMALFMLAFTQIRIDNSKKNTESKAEFLITVTWDKTKTDDVDVYTEDPFNHLVFFSRKEDGLMGIDRDDLGSANDHLFLPDGSIIKYNENREVVTIRQALDGEYVVSVHLYKRDSVEGVPVTVTIDKINPFKVCLQKTVTLREAGEEIMITRFTIKDKQIVSFSDLEKKLAVGTIQPESENFNQ